jgi:hypothetical protein
MKKMKTKMGRPSKGKEARVISIAVKLSAIERAAFRKLAKAAGMPLSAWILQPRRDELAKAKGE